ncbi:SWIM zinc finger family protein [Halomarina pelagica]|uniref:SWIM zinc finger family protein n=1 Tax=Halomarina pelagica TaxID=2961599 RepID=UPI0020C444AA|nr:SWIM zinc finger family protein [Halomarina sp. BND7]
MAVSARGGGIYDVHSQSGNTYTVDLVDGVCSCPDNQFRGERCKHVRRVALEITGGRVPAPGYLDVECRACGRDAFVREDAPAICEECYLLPGTTVRDRETGAFVVVAETTDDRADETVLPPRQETLSAFDGRGADAVEAPEARERDGEERDDDGRDRGDERGGDAAPGPALAGNETTVADYPGNERYPADDPVVRVVYPFSADPETPFESLRRYSFPLSRLERVAPRERDRTPIVPRN